MIQNDAFDGLTEKAIAQLAELFDTFECPNVPCRNCIFALEKPYSSTTVQSVCALGYPKLLNRRLTK